MADYDVIVVGGGVVGVAIAYGLTRLKKRVALVDERDTAIRAARGNFGLVWVQSKGDGCPAYASWTRRSGDLWESAFNDEIEGLTGVETGYVRSGGLHYCLDEEEFKNRRRLMERVAEQSNGAFHYEMWDQETTLKQVPELGENVVGASFSPQDGHVNPLYLLRALHSGFNNNGGSRYFDTVKYVQGGPSGFEVSLPDTTIGGEKIVLAAGLGNRSLGPQLGFKSPVRPQRGQILVTEKLRPFLKFPSLQVRQTVEGSIMIGVSHEDVGMDDGTNAHVMGEIADRARYLFPILEKARIVRAWGALRIMTPDGFPIYDQSSEHPGAFAASAHSGVTLAAVHALEFARFIADGELPEILGSLSERRFDVH